MSEVKSELAITFRYKYEDHRKAFIRNYFAQKLIIAVLIAIPILLVVMLVLWLTTRNFVGYSNFEYVLFFILLALFLIILLLPFLALIQLKHKVRTTYQYGQTDNTAVFNSQSLYWKTPNGEINVQWIKIYKVVEQKEAFCFFFNSREFIIIPKRVLEEEQIKFLRNLLRECIGFKFSIQELDKLKRIDQ